MKSMSLSHTADLTFGHKVGTHRGGVRMNRGARGGVEQLRGGVELLGNEAMPARTKTIRIEINAFVCLAISWG